MRGVGDGAVVERARVALDAGSGLTETATGPGSTLTARGGADSLWLQRFAFLKLQPLDTVELYRNACSVIFGPCDEFPDLEHDACRLAFVAPLKPYKLGTPPHVGRT